MSAPQAKGTGHFLEQRFTALLNLPLGLFFFWALSYAGADPAKAAAFFGQIPMAALSLAFIFNTLFHMRLGMEMVLEDYVPQPGRRLALKWLNRMAVLAGAGVSSAAFLALIVRQH